MLKIGYGKADYQEMITRNFYYADRTRFFEVMENLSGEYMVYLRPRRFGKSLWISTLQYYYGINYKDKFQTLFGHLHVGKHPTPLANSYYILRMNFSGLDTDNNEALLRTFRHSVRGSISSFFARHPETLPKNTQEEILALGTATDILRGFFQSLQDVDLPHKIYLLIDEYDHFANELISFRLDSFREIVSKNGWVRKFYEVIKNAANDGIVGRMFITGVSPITLDSLTSGFNIVRNYSDNAQLHDLMGFTEAEVNELLEKIQNDKTAIPATMSVLKEWYNGYKFSIDSKEKLYNPVMVLYFVSEFAPFQKAPRKMLDTNIASDYSKISRLFKIGKWEEERWEYIDKLMEGEAIEIEMTEIFNFEKGFSTNDLISLLYYMGYLTLKEAGEERFVKLNMPNRVIANLYRDYFIQIMNQRAGLSEDIMKLNEALITLMRNNNPRPILAILCQTLKELSHRDFQKLDEKHVQAMFFCYANLAHVYDTKSEYQAEKKYYDILMLKNGLATEKTQHEFLFEFKYVRKATEERLGKIDAAAKKQIADYLTHKQITHHPNLHAWRIVIVGDTLEICEEVIN